MQARLEAGLDPTTLELRRLATAALTPSQRRGCAANAQRLPAASGSSPVRRRNAIGIWRLRLTPSFCLRTSLWALAVLGEIPSRAPTSSFEHPAAISAITSRWRSVMGAALLSVASSIMATNLLPRSRERHSPEGVTRDVFETTPDGYVIGTWRRTFGATRSRISVRLSPVHVMPWLRRPMTACAGSGSSVTRSATATASSCVPHG